MRVNPSTPEPPAPTPSARFATRNAEIRARVAAGESLASVARAHGVSRQRVHQLTDYVCAEHRQVALTDVALIREDIHRPAGVVVIGTCAECTAHTKRHVFSYGRVRPQR